MGAKETRLKMGCAVWRLLASISVMGRTRGQGVEKVSTRHAKSACATVSSNGVAESAAEEIGVFLGEIGPLLRQIVQREDSGNGTNRHAGAAIDALDGVNIKHLDVGKSGIFFFGMDAIDRAGVDACRVLGTDAGFRNYVGHISGIFKRITRPMFT